MAQQTETPLRVRRLLKQDIEQVAALYAAAGRDAIWADDAALRTLLLYGELWGGFHSVVLTVCGGLCPIDAPTPLAAAARETDLFHADTVLLLPPAGNAQDAARLTEILLARALQRSIAAAPAALIPVKTGAPFLQGCFAAHLVLTAVRPLVFLRPNYIFTAPEGVQTDGENSIMVAVQETLALSRRLASDWRGTALLGNEIRMEKIER